MARVTVEDCLENVDNRFQLVLVATKRARQLASGVDAYDVFSDEHDTLTATLFANAQQLAFDGEGRIVLPATLMEHANIQKTAAFVGRVDVRRAGASAGSPAASRGPSVRKASIRSSAISKPRRGSGASVRSRRPVTAIW